MKRGLLVIGILLLFLPSVFATTYYVATTGDNSNPGTLASPFRTIQKASDLVVAGDTVYVRGGTYGNFLVYNKHGDANNWITFKPYPGETVVVDAYSNNYANGKYIIEIPGSSYIEINGFKITDSNPNYDVQDNFTNYSVGRTHPGVALSQSLVYGTNATNIRIYNNEIYHTGSDGIDLNGYTHFIEIINNTIYDNGLCKRGYGIYAYGKDVVIRGNIIHDAYGYGIHAYGGPERFLIEDNILYNNGRRDYGKGYPDWGPETEANGRYRGTGVLLWAGSGHIIRNNIIYGNLQGGINLMANNTEVYHNTIYNSSAPDDGSGNTGIYVYDNYAPTVKNNIVYNNSHGNIRFSSLTVASNNLVGTNPLFVDAANEDFHLQSDSPAVDTGETLSNVTFDFEGNSRPQGSAYDIGAYEYTIAAPVFGTGNLISKSTIDSISIDGVLNENAWSQASGTSFSYPTYSDNSVSVYSTWNSNNLYFAYVVNDANLEYVGSPLYQDDGAEIFIDTDNDKAGYDSDDYQFGANINDDTNVAGISSKTTTNSGDYVMEIVIPWSSLNLTTPNNNTVMGLLLGNNDRDNGASSQFDWLGAIDTGSYYNPALWGNITLINLTQTGTEEGQIDTGTSGTSGGGGGGGAGGGTSLTPSVTENQTTETITPLQSIIFTGFNQDLRIKQVEVRVNSEVQNAGLAISKYESRPEVIPVEKPGLVYRYLEFQEINIGDKLDKAIITFFVDRDWVDGNELKPTDVSFFRYNEGVTSWNELPTKYNTSDDDYYYYYYEAESDDFGFFAIGEENRSILETEFGSTAFFLLIGGILVLAIVILVVIKFIFKKRNQAYDAGTYPLNK